MTLIINEIFHSIQGESIFAGQPCVFVRLTGCNLRCAYCDTRYAYSEGRPMALDRIVEHVAAYNCDTVEITGGEPLLQKETPDLVAVLLEKGYQVLMETNGSLDIGAVDQGCVRIVDIKCPGSGEAGKFDPGNLQKMSFRDQVKFVITSRDDYLYAREMMKRIPKQIPPGNVLFSCAAQKLPHRDLAEWLLADGLKARLQLQLHKIIWPDIERGV